MLPRPAFRFALPLALTLASPAMADTARFSVRLLGLRVGQLSVESQTHATSYATRARFRTTGVAGALAKIRFDLSAAGTASASGLAPQRYREDIHTGRRSSSARLTATLGHLRPATTAAARDGPSPPPGALDPATALFAVLRDQPKATLCTTDSAIFDGQRHTHIRLTVKHPAPDAITCSGSFSRVAGYSPAELAERRHFPISVTYRANGPLWQAADIRVRTLHGPVRLTRLP